MVIHVFMAPGLVFMIPGGFSSSLMVPGWSISEPQLGLNPQARSETLKTPNCILAPRSRRLGLWPSGHDDDDDVASKACLTL